MKKLINSLNIIDINILLRGYLEKVAEFTLVRSLSSYRVSVLVTLYYNNVGKTGDLSRAPGAGPGLRGLGFSDRALGPRKQITK